MGTTYYFDKILPSIQKESKEPNPKRQLEIFAYKHKTWLRLGQIGHKNSDAESYTVELSKENAIELMSAINDVINYLGEDL